MNQLQSEEYIFRNAVLREDPLERQEYLKQACKGDDALLCRVQQLLKADDAGAGFLSTPVERPDSELRNNPSTTPTELSEFDIVCSIGHGAMAEVFLVRTKDRYRRTAACKVLREELLGTKTHDQILREGEFLARLQHPAIPAFFGSGVTAAQRPYLLMERVGGQSITDYSRDFQLTVREKIQLFLKVCKGVVHAHTKGVIHRDLKPKNILTAEIDGTPHPKIIDFGISKSTITEAQQLADETKVHEMTGSLAYMSPEHLEKDRNGVDTRSDIYSLGVVLYEMLTGVHPYYEQLCQAGGLEEIVAIIKDRVPMKPSLRWRSHSHGQGSVQRTHVGIVGDSNSIKGDLDFIVQKMMAKDIAERYETVSQVVDDLQNFLDCKPLVNCKTPIRTNVHRWLQRNQTVSLSFIAVLFLAFVFAGYMRYTRQSMQVQQNEFNQRISEIRNTLSASQEAVKLREAAYHVSMPMIEQLIADRDITTAFLEAKKIKDVVADDPHFYQLWESVSTTVSCSQLPVNATFHVKHEVKGSTHWELLGVTPFVHLEVPNGRVQLKISHPDFVSREINLMLPDEFPLIQVGLFESKEKAEAGMVFIPSSLNAEVVIDREGREMSDFWIDQYEVSNADYKEFVDAGGYRDASYWAGLNLRWEGQPITFEQGQECFVDSTGRPGPANWRDGTYVDGRGDYPVEGVSWYEAMAYAAYRGKKLPTREHWRRAASSSYPQVLAQLSNFSSELVPVSNDGKIGYYHTHDLYGNVREWCANSCQGGGRALLGAAIGDADYLFYMPRVYEPWERLPCNGFRCIRVTNEQEYAELAQEPIELPSRTLNVVEREPLESLRHWYEYNQALPLDVEIYAVENRFSRSGEGYRYSVVEINACYEGERFSLHVLEPDGQGDAATVIYIPGIGRYNGPGEFKLSSDRDMDTDLVHRLALRGHRVIYPIYNGTYERWNGMRVATHFNKNPAVAQTHWIHGIQDVFRVVDYLFARDDVDKQKIICLGLSNGAARGVTALALDSRVNAGILVSAGFSNWHVKRPVINQYNYAPHVKQPVLMVTGLQDALYRYENSQVPLYKDLGSKDKQHVAIPGGHLPDMKVIVDRAHDWILARFSD